MEELRLHAEKCFAAAITAFHCPPLVSSPATTLASSSAVSNLEETATRPDPSSSVTSSDDVKSVVDP